MRKTFSETRRSFLLANQNAFYLFNCGHDCSVAQVFVLDQVHEAEAAVLLDCERVLFRVVDVVDVVQQVQEEVLVRGNVVRGQREALPGLDLLLAN